MKSSISSAVVFGSTVTALSSGDGGTFTESHSSMIVCARAGATDRVTGNVSAASSATVVATSARWVTIYSSSTRFSVGSLDSDHFAARQGFPRLQYFRIAFCAAQQHACASHPAALRCRGANGRTPAVLPSRVINSRRLMGLVLEVRIAP